MNFCRGGGGEGVQARRSENSLDNVFLVLSFSAYFTEGVQWFYCRENYTFPRIQRGSNISGGGVQLFSREGVQIAYFYRNPYNPYTPPPWIRTCKLFGRTSPNLAGMVFKYFHCMTRREKNFICLLEKLEMCPFDTNAQAKGHCIKEKKTICMGRVRRYSRDAQTWVMLNYSSLKNAGGIKTTDPILNNLV